MALLQIEEEPEEEPEEPAEDDSEDKEETVDEDEDDEETVRRLHTLLLEDNVKLRIQMLKWFTLLTFL